VTHTVEGATYGFHAKFHDDRFRHSNNIKVCRMVFMMGRSYEVRRRDGLKCHVIYTKFHEARHRGSESFYRGIHTEIRTRTA
jgi:hypothetical protein